MKIKQKNKWKNLEHYVKQKEQRHLSGRSEFLSFGQEAQDFLSLLSDNKIFRI